MLKHTTFNSDLGLNPAASAYSRVSLSKRPNLCVPPFLHPSIRDNCTDTIEVRQSLNKPICVKDLECLEYGKCSRNAMLIALNKSISSFALCGRYEVLQ